MSQGNLTKLLSSRQHSRQHSGRSASTSALPFPELAVLGAELLLALVLGFLLTRVWQGGTAWMMGGMVAGALVLFAHRGFYSVSLKPNATPRKLGQALVGLAIGFSIANSDLVEISQNLPVFLLLTLFLLGSGTAIGYCYSRFSQTNLLTSLLATVPGGVSIMSSIAAEYNRNVALVSLVQIIRVTAVIILIPLIARATAAAGAGLSSSSVASRGIGFAGLQDGLQVFYLLLSLLLAGLLTWGMTRSKVPAAPFLAGLAVGIGFNSLVQGSPLPTIDFAPPPFVGLLGQILLGITIGEYWGNKPAVDKQAITHALSSVGMTLVAGLVASVLALQLTTWDWLTCLLVTAPGGAPEMILVALTLDHNVELVTAGHLVRLIAINLSLPLWVLLFRTLDRHISNPVD